MRERERTERAIAHKPNAQNKTKMYKERNTRKRDVKTCRRASENEKKKNELGVNVSSHIHRDGRGEGRGKGRGAPRTYVRRNEAPTRCLRFNIRKLARPSVT